MSNLYRRHLMLAAAMSVLFVVGLTWPGVAEATPRARTAVSSDVASASLARTPLLSDPVLCPVDWLAVPESAGTGVATEWLQYGQSITVEPLADHIWAGVWFTGSNGPEGWSGTSAPSSYPLPDAPEYSLIARIGDGPYQYVGSAIRTFTNTRPGYVQRVRFRVNDNNPGNGSGAFQVFLRYPCR